MTELGDAGASDQQIIATSGHLSASSIRPYTRKTDSQRIHAARKRVALRNKQAEPKDLTDDASED